MQDMDRDTTIQRLYDVALDPKRFESLLDQWETLAGPLRATEGAALFLDDTAMRSHFERAEPLPDHLPAPRVRAGRPMRPLSQNLIGCLRW